jgi:hypothetical protein
MWGFFGLCERPASQNLPLCWTMRTQKNREHQEEGEEELLMTKTTLSFDRPVLVVPELHQFSVLFMANSDDVFPALRVPTEYNGLNVPLD